MVKVALFLFGYTSRVFVSENPSETVLKFLEFIDGREWCDESMGENISYSNLFDYLRGETVSEDNENFFESSGFEKGGLSSLKEIDTEKDKKMLKGVDAFTFYYH